MTNFGLTPEQHAAIARELYEAERTVRPVALLTERFPAMTQEDAYAIQREGLKLRLADGARIVGRKIGITSRGMMKQLNCDTPDFGCLLAHTEIPEGGACKRDELNVPIVEGELAFIMGEDLDGGAVSAARVAAATAWVVPCFEICDARFPSWKVTVRDTISDNAGAARFMTGGTPKRLNEINARTIGMVIEKNGALLGSAAGAEVMGSPVASVAWLANTLLRFGDCLKKGDVVLSGSFMGADPAKAGDCYTVCLDGFPPLSLRFV